MTTQKLLRFCLAPLGMLTLILLAILLVYGQTYSFSFIWDDNDFIVNNPSLQSWRKIPIWFYDSDCYQCYNTFWRPIRNFSYLADWYLCAKQQLPGWMHIHNVLMHLICALMLLWVLRQIAQLFYPADYSKIQWQAGSLLAVILWAIHPLATETVCWIKCRDDQIFLFFYLWGMGLFITGLLRQKPFSVARTLAIAALGFLSVLSKEMALSFPLILGLLWLLMPQPETDGKKARVVRMPSRSIFELLTFSATLMVLYIALRHAVLGQTQQLSRMSGSFYEDMLTFVRAIARYVEMTIVPVRQMADYSGYQCTTSFFNCDFLAALLFCIFCTGMAFFVSKKNKMILFAWLAFLVSLLPVSNIVPTMQYLAERFMYLPLALLSVIFMGIFVKLCFYLSNADKSRRIVFTTLTAFAILSVILAANLRAAIWKNPLLLFRTTWRDAYPSERILKNGMSTLIYYGLWKEGKDAAESLLRQKDELQMGQEDLAKLHQNIGICYLQLNINDKAISHTLSALELKPDLTKSQLALGMLRGINEQTTEALELFNKVLEKEPDNTYALSNKALALKKLGDIEGAKENWQLALDINPKHEPALEGLKGLKDEATSKTETVSQEPKP
ncbi:tetratricopeptide repeat protein [Candidatus Sumerlaeota bacterium]|nr:hypothetical protein [Candidatus Sumerlaeales bacterium]NLD61868.1 tetratricopeptide repeat protein [Candidatus Sumerlaeota bacterium]